MSLTFESKAHKDIRIHTHTLDIQIMIDFRWSTQTAINIHFAYDEFSYTKSDIVNRKKITESFKDLLCPACFCSLLCA